MKEPGYLFFVCVSHQSYSQRMENHGMSVTVQLSRMSSSRDAESYVYCIHNVLFISWSDIDYVLGIWLRRRAASDPAPNRMMP